MDSSVLTTIIRRHTDAPLRTFSIGFEERSLDESPYQQALIEHLQADHSRITCRNSDVADAFGNAIWHAESVLVRAALVPMMLLSGLVHEQGYRVVLTGEGADEVLGGYDIFKETKVRQFWARQPDSAWRPALLKRLVSVPRLLTRAKSRPISKAFFGVGLDNPSRSVLLASAALGDHRAMQAILVGRLRASCVTGSAVERFARRCRRQIRLVARVQPRPVSRGPHADGRLPAVSQGDRMLMANSVEGRFPFLDHRLIEFAKELRPSR